MIHLLEHDSTPITDENRPPMIIPFCASCDMPVELLTIYPSNDPDFIVIEACCHGQTKGVRIGRVEAAWRVRTNNKLVLFRRREGFDSVR